ncbi:hypothetical protein [Nonomuraea sp. NPDC049784]|uniref:hypothetical protein n=1 Tax=Nonomuraea sp. NPDC049784 TaxID=3154361 RepID=UPI0033EC1B7B
MARANLAVTKMTRAGVTLAGALTPAVVDGHKFSYSAKRQLRIKNTSTGPRTVTAAIPGEVEGQPLGDVPYVLAAGADVLVPPFTPIYRQGDDTVWINYDDPAGVEVAVYELPA